MPERAPRRSPWARQVLVAVLLGGLAFAITVQVRQDETDTYSGARGVELVELLKSLEAANNRLGDQIEELSDTRAELRSTTSRSAAAEEEALRRNAELSILAGTVGATGPGVRLTIDGPTGSVDAGLLLDTVQELRDGGAEVIAINGTARVVAQTWFADDADGIRISGRQVQRPFVIEAIGDADKLAGPIDIRGGIADRVEQRGASLSLDRLDTIAITAVVDAIAPEYARPDA